MHFVAIFRFDCFYFTARLFALIRLGFSIYLFIHSFYKIIFLKFTLFIGNYFHYLLSSEQGGRQAGRLTGRRRRAGSVSPLSLAPSLSLSLCPSLHSSSSLPHISPPSLSAITPVFSNLSPPLSSYPHFWDYTTHSGRTHTTVHTTLPYAILHFFVPQAVTLHRPHYHLLPYHHHHRGRTLP